MACDGKSECTCVSRIIKLDPNLTLKRESLFVSSEAQAIIEELTGVSSNGKIIAKVSQATPEQERASPEEQTVKQEDPEEKKQHTEDGAQSSGNVRAKSAKKKGKISMEDVAKRAMATPKLYQNDRTARAVMKWRTFRTNFENGNQRNDELEEDEIKDKQSTEDQPSTKDATIGELDKDVQPDSTENADQPEVPEVPDDDVVDEELTQRSRPGTAFRAGPLGLPINRPAGARFGRRYSMPVAVISGLPLAQPKVSLRHTTPGVSPRSSSPPRSPSPTRHSYLSAGIAHLHTNREKLSTLFNERSAIISTLDKQKAQKDLQDVKLLTRRLGRRASDSTASPSQFRERNKMTEATQNRLFNRRASLSTAHIARAMADLEDSSTTNIIPNSSGSLHSVNGKDAARAESKSCENIAEQRFRHVPCPPRDRRRGSVCVGQIARAREVLRISDAPVSPRKHIEHEAKNDSKPFNPIEAKQDNDERITGNTFSDVLSQCGQFVYYNQRRGSLSMVPDGKEDKPSSREMTEKMTKSCPDSFANGAEKDYRKKELIDVAAGLLTVENVSTHNAMSRYSQLKDDKSLPSISPRGKPKGIEQLTDSLPSTSRLVTTEESTPCPERGDCVDSPSTSNAASTPKHPNRESTPFAQPADLTFKYYNALQRRSSLFLRTEREIVEDVEQELQEQVARRKRQLQATRCVSAKGAQRLQARALAQSAGGRLKRNLREVTRQRTTKDLILMDGERRRLRREAPVTY